MRLYLSGPMTGHEGCNYPAFAAAASVLRAAGHAIASPAEIDHPGETAPGSLPWAEYLRRDLALLLTCTGIVLLPGWQTSKGARLELLVAVGLGFEIFVFPGGAGGLVPVSGDPAL